MIVFGAIPGQSILPRPPVEYLISRKKLNLPAETLTDLQRRPPSRAIPSLRLLQTALAQLDVVLSDRVGCMPQQATYGTHVDSHQKM
jgi:hypothetical protein